MARRILIGAGLGLALLIVLDAVATRLGLAPGAIPKLAGTAAWTTARAAGVIAFVALTLDVVFGLLVSTGAADRLVPRGRSVEIHRWLSSVALALTAGHAVVLLGDRFVRFDVLDLLVPFLSPYRAVAVGLGILAGYGALVVHLSFGVRRRLGVKTWRRLHFLSFAVFGAALTHGVLAGSDSGRVGMQLLYLGSAALVAGLTLHRAVVIPIARRATRRGQDPGGETARIN